MTSDIGLLATSLNAAPGEVLAAMVQVSNTSAVSVTHRATPIGLGDDLSDVWKGQALVVPANSVLVLPVQIPVPPSFGIGHHAVAIEIETDADVPVLLPLTLAIASIERVELRATPNPMRGRRKVKFILDVVNREPHTVELLLESETPDVDVSFEMATMTLGPGQQTWTRGRVRGPRKLVGDRTQHNLKLTARGRASSSSIAVPYIQRPVFAYRLRSTVAVAVVLALWVGAMAFVSQRYVFNKANDGVAAPITSVDEPVGDDGLVSIPGALDADTGEVSDDATDLGDSPGEARASDEPGDAGAGDASEGADQAGSLDGTEGPTADTPVEVRGTIDVVGGGIDGVTITPVPMSLRNVAELDPNVTSFTAASRPKPRKVWSARGIIAPAEPVRMVQTEPVPAGDFAPNAEGIWALPLAQRQVYELIFSKPGFQTQAFVITPELGNTVDLAVELKPATGELGGVVTGGGRLLENVVLLITTGTFDYQTVTDGNGRWALTGLDTSADYTIVASLDGYGADVRRVRLAPGEPQTNVSIALPFGQSILQGVVTDTSGARIRGAKVTASNGSESRSTTTLTDEGQSPGGSYQLPELETNAVYSVRIELDGYETATARIRLGSLTQVENFTLEAKAAQVSGRVVTDSGEPIGGATVTLDIDTVAQPISAVQTIRDGEVGFFSLGLIRPGRYRLTVVQWEHETTRGELVVTSANQSTLSGEPGPIFEIEMTPLPPRDPADRPLGSLAFDVIDSNATVTCTAGDCRRIDNTVIKITTTDPTLFNSARFDDGVFQCDTDTGECNTTNETDYRVTNIPIGSYRVLFENPDYNTTSKFMTVVSGDEVAAEEILMVRLGDVSGAFLVSNTNESIYEPSLVWVVPADSRNPDCAPGVVDVIVTSCGQVPTEYVENTSGESADTRFQSSAQSLLPPGRYGLQVRRPEGYLVADDQVLVPGEDPFTFVVGETEEASNSVSLNPIYADPYPTIDVRLFRPDTVVSPNVTFRDLNVDTPSATLTCGAVAVEASSVTASSVSFNRGETNRVDPDGDGDFGVCSLAVSAIGFDETIYPFGSAQANGVAPAELTLGIDRSVDVALLPQRVGTTVDLVGLLSWSESGTIQSIDDADITVEPVITAILGGEPADGSTVRTAEPVVLALQKSVGPVVGAAENKATWDSWQSVEQVIGQTTLTFSASGFPLAQLSVTVNGDGTQSFDPITNLAVDIEDGKLDVTMDPDPGRLVGNVTIVTGDPDPDFSSLQLSAQFGSAPATLIDLANDGSYAVPAAAGTWATTVDVIPPNHRPLAPLEQINVNEPSQFLPKTQFVPPGGDSDSYGLSLLELGSVNLTVNGPTGGDVEYSIDSGASLPLTSPHLISSLEVPTSGTDTTDHTIRLTKADGFDLGRATVEFRQTYLAATPGELEIRNDVDLSEGLVLPFAAGTKYDVNVDLRRYGNITGEVIGESFNPADVDICSSGTEIKATITATPTKIITTDGSDVVVVDLDRPVLSVETCGSFSIAGEAGDYRLEIEHEEFDDIAPQQVTMPDPEEELELPVSTLTLLRSPFTVKATELLGNANIADDHVFFTLDTDDFQGSPTLMAGGEGDVEVFPRSGYTLTVRSCAEAPVDRDAFNLCVSRFPAIVPLAVARSTDVSTLPTTVEVTLLQIGGTIDLQVSFENAGMRNVCPEPAIPLEFSRDFDRSQSNLDQATVNGEAAAVSSFGPENVQTNCTLASFDTVRFDSLVASGTHTIRIPEVAGFGPPTVEGYSVSTAIDGSYSVAITYAAFPNTMTIPIRYEAEKVDANFYICGRNTDDTPRCTEEFPGLAVELISPAGGRYPATVGERVPEEGYPISRAGLDPEPIAYTVSIQDELHEDGASTDLMVTAGLQARPTITFPGSTVRVAIHPKETPGPGLGVEDMTTIETVTLEGQTSEDDWTVIRSNSWPECTINGVLYTFCDSGVSGDFVNLRAVVVQTGYIDGVATEVSPGLGQSLVLQPNSVKRAVVRIEATVQDDGGESINFPSSLVDAVQLVREDEQVSNSSDRLPSSPACDNFQVSACFDFYVDPGYQFYARTDAFPNYLSDQSDLTTSTTVGEGAKPGTTLSINFVPSTAPSVPQNVSAVSGDGKVTVSWDAPADLGGLSISNYTVTTVGGSSKSCELSPCEVSGLTNGTEYTFTVLATNSAGSSPASSPPVAATPTP
ncbi:carboxypeptidase regulatory-like domain-containing protein [Ilumatobacter sp.]|uniref:carboxypeptidase regulatory-like domain-containing protein n=1 Tax=Ilumatobacter sp. TaxID=1967498 RepID=UPI002A280A05|nr:carboxypeptidase regulatory-like domain-containing protein [Ilumatobacter sp.]